MTASVTAAPADSAAVHYRRAVELRREIGTTSNAIRIAMLGMELRDELDRSLLLNPDHVQARLELVRYLVHAPPFAGGGLDAARVEAREVARRDAAAGHFALGYIVYRDQQFGVARTELRAAVEESKSPEVTEDALTWLGWLSQSSQAWAEAFTTWDRLLREYPARSDALYEIGRTATFCHCERERGEAALLRYLPKAKGERRSAVEKMLAELRLHAR